ncbi:MAG TPA: NAD(P)/FAD-dependent oxidoreductase [Solirubrobacteraceae bacterium]|nr:NAD(P)/FAD-dependent oxidoreductase [Solirubrobacteraceae bacterium]
MNRHVVIAGGGFGGYYTAKGLERMLDPEVRITMVSDVNFMLYTPLLPGAAAGTLEPRHVVVPLREHLRRTELRLGWVTGADPLERTLAVHQLSGDDVELRYDQLVVALGSVSRTFPIPGLAEHGMGFKTISEAIALRNRLVRCLETAEETDDEDMRRQHLGFVFVGAGYAGLEGIAELQDFAVDALPRYPRCTATGMRWVLVEAGSRVMPGIQPQLAQFATELMRERGIDVRLETQLTEVTPTSVTLSTGETIPCRTVCWTAGVRGNPIAERLGLPLSQGRIRVRDTMQVEGFDDVWALGDIAAVPDPARPGQPAPPTAQHAIRQGKLMARNVAGALRGEPPRPFTFKTLGVFADLGRHKAVANLMGLRVKGLLAWSVGRLYHLAWIPGMRHKVRLLIDWSVEFLFERDTAELGALGHPPSLVEHPAPPAQVPG